MRFGRVLGRFLAVTAGLGVVIAAVAQANAVPIGQGVGQRVKYPTPFGANAGKYSPTGRGAQPSANDALLQQFDTNGNGRIDTSERKAMQSAAAQLRAGGGGLSNAQLIQQFDTNGNGRLDGNELKSAKSALGANSAIGGQGLSGGAVQAGGVQGGFAPQGVGGAAGGAATKATTRPFGNASKQKILEEFDTNGDGSLDTKERIAMTKIRAEQRRELAEQKKADAKAGAKGAKAVPKADAKADEKAAAAKP